MTSVEVWNAIQRAYRFVVSFLTGGRAEAPTQQKPFVRVLDPSDPWLGKDATKKRERTAVFRGKQHHHISVAMECRCEPARVVAVLHGARRDVVLGQTAFFRFTDDEVTQVGGTLEDTEAIPPWPDDYNHAHHDITQNQDRVAAHMVGLHELNQIRVCEVDELDILVRIAKLLTTPNVHPKFQKAARYRFGRMFKDGGRERDLWEKVAARELGILEINSTEKALKRLFQDKGQGRKEWTALFDRLGVPMAKRNRFR